MCDSLALAKARNEDGRFEGEESHISLNKELNYDKETTDYSANTYGLPRISKFLEILGSAWARPRAKLGIWIGILSNFPS